MSSGVCGALSPSRASRVPFWVVASLGLTASGASGCLADPPTFAPRGQIPPFIIAGQVVPPLASIYKGPADIEINVPFRSEDVNTDLLATLYLDLAPGGQGASAGGVLGFQEVAAGNYEEPRLLSMGVPIPSTGCRSLTLVMTYVDNLDRRRDLLPVDEDRAARIVWWLNIGDENGETRMADCPGASQDDAVPSAR